MRIDKNTTIRLGGRNIVKVKLGDVVIWQKTTEPEPVGPDYFYIESLGDANTVSVINKGDGSTSGVTPTLEYSKDKSTWNTITFDWTSGEHTTELPVKLNTGEKMYFRNDTRKFSNNYNKYISFSLSVSSNVGGDIRTLSNYLNVDSETTAQRYMFKDLFRNNKNIVNASNLRLSYTTLADYCYSNMFWACSKLTAAPALPATTLAESCCRNMFESCTSLTTAPELPATKLASNCYQYMFSGCTSLTSAPELPATTLVSYCYGSMFQGCTKLTTAPELPATTLASNCYYHMFYDCIKLNSITVFADNISATNCTADWLSGVASTGTFRNLGSATYPTNSPSGIPSGWTEVKPVVGPDYFYIESLGDANTVSVINQGNGNTDSVTPTLEYSTDKNTWNTITFDWTYGEHTTELPVKLNTGEKMYFRNDTRKFSNDYNKYITFSSTVSSNVGGDIRTLSNYLDVNSETTPQTYMFYYLFYNNKNIVDASNLRLPYTTLASDCYNSMFNGCTSLTTAPTLPATNLAETCYSQMFRGCTSLVNAPKLPATTLADSCYHYMFYGCTSLTTAPALPATTLVYNCYYAMFNGCTSLTTAPTLPATTLAKNCYQWMFFNCTSLVNAPELPATTLAEYCYSNMFRGCTSLVNAPALPATSLENYCYERMYQDCTSLTSVTIYATSYYYYSFNLWLSNVASSGTVYNNGLLDLTKNSESGIPNGWTEVMPEIQSITANPDTFTIEFNNETVTCKSTIEVTTTAGTFTNTNSVNFTVGENTGNTTRTITETIPYKGSSYDVTIVQSAIQSITANPDTFTIKSYKSSVTCTSTLTITTTLGTTVTDTNSATITVGENTGDTTRTLTETIPYKGSSYQVTIVQTANDVKPAYSWNVESTGTYPFELNTNGYYESTNKGHDSSYSYATLNYEGFENLVLECINSGESSFDYGIISQPDVQLSESTSDDGATGSTNVFHNFKGQSSTNPVQLTIPTDGGSHFITIKFRKDGSSAEGNDSLQFKVIEP